MSTAIRLVALREESNFVPLGVLGYCLMRTKFLQPVFSELRLKQKTVKHPPEAKLIDLLVSILTGCRAIAQVNTRLRPDVVLAQAWGRPRFTEQSLLADTLDAFDETALSQLRQGSAALLHREGRVFRHDFAQTWLWLDIDLTPLPISKLAEASTKGKFAKKTVMAANWRGFTHPNITKRSFRSSIPVSKTVARPIFPCSRPWRRRSTSRWHSSNAPCCVRMPALAVTAI